jgi:methyl-accepting chemotaxis protein
MKISTTLNGIAAALLVFSFFRAALVFVQLDAMSKDGRVVNYAGVVRGGAQRLDRLQLACKPSDEGLARLDESGRTADGKEETKATDRNRDRA